jgi:hypothetical protein
LQSRVAAAQKEAAKANMRLAVDAAVEKADEAAAAGQRFTVIQSEGAVDVLALREAATTIITKHKVGRWGQYPGTRPQE